MRYHNNGVLRTEQDSTLWLKRGSRKRKLNWLEFIPPVALCIFIVGLLMSGIFW